MQAVHHLPVSLGRLFLLFLEDRSARPGDPGEEQLKRIAQLLCGAQTPFQGRRLDRPVASHLQAGNPSKGSQVVVVFADGMAGKIHFDVVRLLGQLLRLHFLPLEFVPRRQQRHQVASRRADPVPSGTSAIERARVSAKASTIFSIAVVSSRSTIF
jgi:hypothetical protein